MFAGALAFLAGDTLVQLLPALPVRGWVCLPLALLALCGSRRWLIPCCFLLGFLWAWAHALLALAGDLRPELEGRDLVVAGHVASLPELAGDDTQFLLDVASRAAPGASPLPRRLQLTWYDATAQPAPGEHWQFTVRLRRRHGFANPGGFDYEALLFRQDIGATGYVRPKGDNRQLSGPSPRYVVLRLRAHIAAALADALPTHRMLGLVQGLAVGERQQIPAEQWRVFAATGTSHLMAISGLHIAMVAALTAWLGGGIARLPGMQSRGLNAVDGRAIGCLAGAFVYAALAGFDVPAQRTLAMLGVYCGSRLLRRELQATQGLAVSLFAVLLLDPFAPLSAGAWLSFGAVGAILGWFAGRPRRAGGGRWRRPLGEFLQTQWVVTAGLLPLLVLIFGQVSLVSPLVNLLAIPFFTWLVVPLVLLGTLAQLVAMPLGPGSSVLGAAAGLLDAAWPFLTWCASLDLSVWHLPQAPWWISGLLCLGCVLVVAPGFAVTRLIGLLLCLPALCWRPPALEQGEFRLTVLDVGQGLAAVVETRSHALLFDAGPAFRSGRDTGEMVVLPYLRARALRRLDLAIASHGDRDHVGGLASVLSGVAVGAVLAGPSVRSAAAQPVRCQRGQHWRWDGVGFAILHPALPAANASDNDTSCVVRITASGGSALLLGDIERDAERELVAAGLIEPTRIVVAAHHGSRTSSTPELVAAVQARYVLFAAGYRNRWGFPRPDVVERWRAAGAEPFSTSVHGAIEVRVGANGSAPPVSYRQQSRRYWHAEQVMLPATMRSGKDRPETLPGPGTTKRDHVRNRQVRRPHDGAAHPVLDHRRRHHP